MIKGARFDSARNAEVFPPRNSALTWKNKSLLRQPCCMCECGGGARGGGEKIPLITLRMNCGLCYGLASADTGGGPELLNTVNTRALQVAERSDGDW